jgi:hypothetical protein
MKFNNDTSKLDRFNVASIVLTPAGGNFITNPDNALFATVEAVGAFFWPIHL